MTVEFHAPQTLNPQAVLTNFALDKLPCIIVTYWLQVVNLRVCVLCCYIKQEVGVTKAVFCTLFFTESYFVAYSKCKGRCSSHTHVSVWHSRTG